MPAGLTDRNAHGATMPKKPMPRPATILSEVPDLGTVGGLLLSYRRVVSFSKSAANV